MSVSGLTEAVDANVKNGSKNLSTWGLEPVPPSPNYDAQKRIITLDALPEPPSERARACIVILCRNSDLNGASKSVKQLEEIFNARYQYPYVYLNELPFTDEFKDAARSWTKSDVQFGLIPHEHWSYPSWVDQEKAAKCRKDMQARNIIYGGVESYRHMCRFNSLFFFQHELLQQFDFYWRVEPDIEFFCTLPYDPFVFMRDNGKVYGFNVMLPEYRETIKTLWPTTLEFMTEHWDLIPEKNSLDAFVDNNGDYNLCHFWSNFEIADMRFFRSKAYTEYGKFLDQTGNFFYERWGDAPVHSLAVAMFLSPDRIHFFEDIGYKHPPYMNCPINPALQQFCRCDPSKSVAHGNVCMDKFLEIYKSR